MVIHTLFRNQDGATLVEFSIIMPLLFLMTFSFLEFGYVFFQFNNAQKATQLGARVASTRAMISGVEDCWISSNEPAGTDCASINNSSGSPIVCSGNGTGSCNATGMAEVVAQMQSVYPQLNPVNIQVTFSPTSLGYIGRGKPIPAVTVEIRNEQYQFIVVDKLVGLIDANSNFSSSVGIPPARTTTIGEDIGEGA